MTQDEEMKDRPTPIPSTLQRINSIFLLLKSKPLSRTEISFLISLSDLKEIASIIETGSNLKEVRKISRAVRLTIGLRSKLTAHVLSSFLHHVLPPASHPHSKLSSYLPNSKVIPLHLWGMFGSTYLSLFTSTSNCPNVFKLVLAYVHSIPGLLM